MSGKLLLSNKEVARRYGLPYEMVLAMSKIERGGPPGIRHGNRFLWLSDEVESYITRSAENRLAVGGKAR